MRFNQKACCTLKKQEGVRRRYENAGDAANLLI